MRTTQSEEIRKKIELKKGDIDEWMKKYHIDDGKKDEIMKNINKKLEEDKDAELENLFNVLPGYMKKYLKHLLCFKTLSQVRFSTSLRFQVFVCILFIKKENSDHLRNT